MAGILVSWFENWLVKPKQNWKSKIIWQKWIAAIPFLAATTVVVRQPKIRSILESFLRAANRKRFLSSVFFLTIDDDDDGDYNDDHIVSPSVRQNSNMSRILFSSWTYFVVMLEILKSWELSFIPTNCSSLFKGKWLKYYNPFAF